MNNPEGIYECKCGTTLVGAWDEKARAVVFPECPKCNHCEICKDKVVIMIYGGTGVCSDICRKVRDGELLSRP